MNGVNQLNKRERLIEIVDKAKANYVKGESNCTESEYIVQSLLDSGVIFPPCKLGCTVYRITYSFVSGKRIEHISKPIQIVGYHLGAFPTIRGHKRKNCLIGYVDGLLIHLDIKELGKTIFFSEEDVKRKMKEDESAE